MLTDWLTINEDKEGKVGKPETTKKDGGDGKNGGFDNRQGKNEHCDL
jgi:hypothetical protein